jgi:immunity protein 51 of polymorphic toxin system
VSDPIAPFRLVETSPGNFSLLLSEFVPASEVFDAAGVEAGGYAWGAVARHLVEGDLEERLGLDPEASMFCAYGTDRAALEQLAGRLAALFHDHAALAKLIEEIGPENFDD